MAVLTGLSDHGPRDRAAQPAVPDEGWSAVSDSAAGNIAKGARITGHARDELAEQVRRRYEGGESIRSQVLPRIEPIYALHKSSDRLEGHFFSGGHSFPDEAQRKA